MIEHSILSWNTKGELVAKKDFRNKAKESKR